MSTMLLNLNDRIITDTGTMIAKHNLLVSLALNDEPFTHLPTVPHSDISLYHHYHRTVENARVWIDDGIVQGPSLSTFGWKTPEPYASLDIVDTCMTGLLDLGLASDGYTARMIDELDFVQRTQMDDFIRCLIWITDVLRANGLVWGLGRGSSCASLIMFVLRVNKVDPVRYDIPMEEFYK